MWQTTEDKFDLWLIAGGGKGFSRDPEICHALLQVARHEEFAKSAWCYWERFLENAEKWWTGCCKS